MLTVTFFHELFVLVTLGTPPEELCMSVSGFSHTMLTKSQRGSGRKFERKKVLITEKINLFSSQTFFLLNEFWIHMELEGVQKWQTTHSKVYSK